MDPLRSRHLGSPPPPPLVHEPDEFVGLTCPICWLDHSRPPLEALLRAHNAYTSSNPEYATFGARKGDGGGLGVIPCTLHRAQSIDQNFGDHELGTGEYCLGLKLILFSFFLLSSPQSTHFIETRSVKPSKHDEQGTARRGRQFRFKL